MADYDFDLENVANALAKAAGRGVRVRMVTDTDTLTKRRPARSQKAFGIPSNGQAKIPIVDRSRRQRPAIMHDKFVVVDGAAVWTGSWNFTDGDTYHLNNNAIKIVSRELAQNYTAEFEKMFVQRKFGPNKPAGAAPERWTIHGVPDRELLRRRGWRRRPRSSTSSTQAKQSIHFLAFSFTNDAIGRRCSHAPRPA